MNSWMSGCCSASCFIGLFVVLALMLVYSQVVDNFRK